MAELASHPLSLGVTKTYVTEYGTQSGTDSGQAWDHDVMYGCLCDSSWAVGFAAGQTQLSEFFGPGQSSHSCVNSLDLA